MKHQVALADAAAMDWDIPGRWRDDPADLVWSDPPWSALSAIAMYRAVGWPHRGVCIDTSMVRTMANVLECARGVCAIVGGASLRDYQGKLAQLAAHHATDEDGPYVRVLSSTGCDTFRCWVMVCGLDAPVFVPETATPYRVLHTLLEELQPRSVLISNGWRTNRRDVEAAVAVCPEVRVATIDPAMAEWCTQFFCDTA